MKTAKGRDDKDAERVVAHWLRVADRTSGREGHEGRCDRCGGEGYLSRSGAERLCSWCYLEGGPIAG